MPAKVESADVVVATRSNGLPAFTAPLRMTSPVSAPHGQRIPVNALVDDDGADCLPSTGTALTGLDRPRICRHARRDLDGTSAGELRGADHRKGGTAAAASWEDHAEAGETAQPSAIIFFVLLAPFILIPWFLERRAANTTPPGFSRSGSPCASQRWS